VLTASSFVIDTIVAGVAKARKTIGSRLVSSRRRSACPPPSPVHSMMSPAASPLAPVAPSGDSASAVIARACRATSRTSPVSRLTVTTSPFSVPTATVPGPPKAARTAASGATVTCRTALPVCVSRTARTPLLPTTASSRPSGENARSATLPTVAA
jgi:hypothetical protein